MLFFSVEEHCSKMEREVSSKYKMRDYLMRDYFSTHNNMQYAKTHFSMMSFLQLQLVKDLSK